MPGVVITAKLVTKPFASVTLTAFGSFKQLFGAGAAATPTVKIPFASGTVSGLAVTIARDDGDTAMV